MPRPARWFRFYSETLDNPKIQRLRPQLFKVWVNLLLLANAARPRGSLPSVAAIAFRLRISEDVARKTIKELVALRLVDAQGDGFAMHDWDDWQYESDVPSGGGQVEPSVAGSMGNHRRWHEGRSLTVASCPFCIAGVSQANRGRIGGESQGESQGE